MKWMLPAAAVAALALPGVPAYAAGPYDGTWTASAPAVAGGAVDYDLEACNAVQFQFDVKDNQVVGNLRRTQYPQSGVNVTSAPGRGGTPISGGVSPDGALTAAWQSYRATGQMSGDKGQLQWKGQCGPRVAQLTRVAKPAAAAAGTTTPPAAPPAHAIYFDTNKASLGPSGEKIVQQVAEQARANPNARVTVTGKADRVGSEDHNMKLSERRAQAVSKALVSAGVPADRIEARGVGEKDLPVPTADHVAEPKNRVADVVVQ